MSWKTNIQVRDLDDDQRLEATCKDCDHVHYITKFEVMRQGADRSFLYLDEIEREAICRARGCRGAIRLALVRTGDTSSFVGGLA